MSLAVPFRLVAVSMLFHSTFFAVSRAELAFPGKAPGTARADVQGTSLVLENEAIALRWSSEGDRLRPVLLEDRIVGRRVSLAGSETFQLRLARTPLPGTYVVGGSEMKVIKQPAIISLVPNSASVRVVERHAGKAIVVRLATDDRRVEVEWRAELRDGSNYIRQSIACRGQRGQELKEAVLWDLAMEAEVAGVVDGSPVVAENLFFAVESPLGKSRVEGATSGKVGAFTCSYSAAAELVPDVDRRFTSVVGVCPKGQLRRGFLYYLERERAQPYRQLLHYNNGSEIGCEYWRRRLFGKPEEAEAFRAQQERLWLEIIDAFGRELVERRHVTVDSFAHDFEWDDENLVWQFHSGYPQGFRPARERAAHYQSAVGVWLSPAGGYPGKKYRLQSGREQAFEPFRVGLTMAGPRYRARFETACLNMIRNYGVNYFKFDGFGAGNNQAGAMDCASDVEALLDIIVRLREVSPTVFINPSTGSWPSPFWLLSADSIWRQGADTGTEGKGSARQKWITYRDGQIVRGTLRRGRLYPVNSLMIHGVFINRLPLFGNPYDPKNPRPTYEPAEITAEIRSFFATGTNLQEMYIDPSLMIPRTWDVLAEAARWARANASVLVDTHHFGGDPLDGEVYGFSSWTPAKAILMLRNPGDTPAEYALDVGQAFELPASAPQRYRLKSPWVEEAQAAPLEVTAGQPQRIALPPFAVRVWEATPK